MSDSRGLPFGVPTGLLVPFLAEPDRSGLYFDFDGTLAAIVEDPAASRPLPGVVTLLTRLAARFGAVGAISGRPAAFLAEHLPAGISLSGLYGLEEVHNGAITEHVEAAGWRLRVDEAVGLARRAAPAGVLVEPKGLSLTLHYRTRPEAASAVSEMAAEIAEVTGLEPREAKASIELHPPIDTDKGQVLSRLVAGADVAQVLYVGDDLGDLPAFAALADLRRQGLITLAVAVTGAETPDEVRSAVDAEVVGPNGVLDLMERLAAV